MQKQKSLVAGKRWSDTPSAPEFTARAMQNNVARASATMATTRTCNRTVLDRAAATMKRDSDERNHTQRINANVECVSNAQNAVNTTESETPTRSDREVDENAHCHMNGR